MISEVNDLSGKADATRFLVEAFGQTSCASSVGRARVNEGDMACRSRLW